MDEAVGTATLRRLTREIAELDPAVDDAERIDRIRLFEELKAVAAAAQLETGVAFAASQRARRAAAGEPPERRERGVASQFGLAMRTSPARAQRWLGFAKVLTAELPATHAELRAGRTTEWRAMLVARETAMLSEGNCRSVDAEIAPRLEKLGDRRVECDARAAAYRLDPAAAAERARRATGERRVTVRPAPDTMCRVTATLGVAQGVASWAALKRDADAMIATGENLDAGGHVRSRSQLMADLFVERLTGKARADDVAVEIELVMTDATLFDGAASEPAHVIGYGSIPAPTARELALGPRDSAAKRWIRRLFMNPAKPRLLTMETARYAFTPAQRRFLRLRDQTCRTPWCDAPVAHADHVRPYADGGATDIGNAQGLCETCNHAKQAVDWYTTQLPDGVVLLRTPTGHCYLSRAPVPPGGRPDDIAAIARGMNELVAA